MKPKEQLKREWLNDLGRNLEMVCSALSDIGATQDTLNKAYARLNNALEETPYTIGHVELLEEKNLSGIVERAKLALSKAQNVKNLTAEEVNSLDAEVEELVQNILNPNWG